MPMSQKRSTFLACALLALASITQFPLQAQNLGSISGVITDNGGLPVPNADIKLTDENTGLARTFKSSGLGDYAAPSLPAGAYTLEVNASGFAPNKRTGVVL